MEKIGQNNQENKKTVRLDLAVVDNSTAIDAKAEDMAHKKLAERKAQKRGFWSGAYEKAKMSVGELYTKEKMKQDSLQEIKKNKYITRRNWTDEELDQGYDGKEKLSSIDKKIKVRGLEQDNELYKKTRQERIREKEAQLAMEQDAESAAIAERFSGIASGVSVEDFAEQELSGAKQVSELSQKIDAKFSDKGRTIEEASKLKNYIQKRQEKTLENTRGNFNSTLLSQEELRSAKDLAESRENKLTINKVEEILKHWITEYARSGGQNPTLSQLAAEKNKLVKEELGSVFGKRFENDHDSDGYNVEMIDNIEIQAERARAAYEKLTSAGNQVEFEVNLRLAKASSGPETKHVGGLYEKVRKSPLGALVSAPALGLATGAAMTFTKIMTGSAASKFITFGASSAVYGIVSGYEQKKNLERDRAQLARDYASGLEFDSSKDPASRELIRYVHLMTSSKTILEEFKQVKVPEEVSSDGKNLDTDLTNIRLGLTLLAEEMARMDLQAREKIDLTKYSAGRMEQERLQIRRSFFEKKAALKNYLKKLYKQNNEMFWELVGDFEKTGMKKMDAAQREAKDSPNEILEEIFLRLRTSKMHSTQKSIDSGRLAFDSYKWKEAASVAVKRTAFGFVGSVAAQEVAATVGWGAGNLFGFNHGKVGLIEKLKNGQLAHFNEIKKGGSGTTALASLFHNSSNEVTISDGNFITDTRPVHARMDRGMMLLDCEPDDVEVDDEVEYGDHRPPVIYDSAGIPKYELVEETRIPVSKNLAVGGEIILKDLKIDVVTGEFTPESIARIKAVGLSVEVVEETGAQRIVTPVAVNEFLDKASREGRAVVTEVEREHLDNGTSRPDGNELKMKYGGKMGTGFDKDGNVVIDVSGMFNRDSSGEYSTSIKGAARAGALDLLVSVDKNTAGTPIAINFDAQGKAMISPDHPAYKLFTKDSSGKAVFTGGYLETGIFAGTENSSGPEQYDIAVTVIGKNTAVDAAGNIVGVYEECNIPAIQKTNIIAAPKEEGWFSKLFNWTASGLGMVAAAGLSGGRARTGASKRRDFAKRKAAETSKATTYSPVAATTTAQAPAAIPVVPTPTTRPERAEIPAVSEEGVDGMNVGNEDQGQENLVVEEKADDISGLFENNISDTVKEKNVQSQSQESAAQQAFRGKEKKATMIPAPNIIADKRAMDIHRAPGGHLSTENLENGAVVEKFKLSPDDLKNITKIIEVKENTLVQEGADVRIPVPRMSLLTAEPNLERFRKQIRLYKERINSALSSGKKIVFDLPVDNIQNSSSDTLNLTEILKDAGVNLTGENKIKVSTYRTPSIYIAGNKNTTPEEKKERTQRATNVRRAISIMLASKSGKNTEVIPLEDYENKTVRHEDTVQQDRGNEDGEFESEMTSALEARQKAIAFAGWNTFEGGTSDIQKSFDAHKIDGIQNEILRDLDGQFHLNENDREVNLITTIGVSNDRIKSITENIKRAGIFNDGKYIIGIDENPSAEVNELVSVLEKLGKSYQLVKIPGKQMNVTSLYYLTLIFEAKVIGGELGLDIQRNNKFIVRKSPIV